jgi:hypothetical protein
MILFGYVSSDPDSSQMVPLEWSLMAIVAKEIVSLHTELRMQGM